MVPILLVLCSLNGASDREAGRDTDSDNVMSGDAIFADVVRYAAFGEHRTGTKGDLQTSAWLLDELKKAGIEASEQPWDLRQFFLTECRLEVNGKKLDSFPFWYPNATGPEGLLAPLAMLDNDTPSGALKGRIAYVNGAALGENLWIDGVNLIAERAAREGAVGLVAVVRNYSMQVAAINARAPYHQSPLPIPTVLVSGADETALDTAAAEGAEALLVLTGKDDLRAEANNVVGTIERGPKWIVVTTPSSGWFRCSGERGPGVALFLAMARWAAQHPGELSYLFLANAGHELDNVGAHHSLDKYGPPVEDVACWIHLGASIATRAWKTTETGFEPLPHVAPGGNLVGTPDLVPLLERAFADAQALKPRSGEPIAGELRHFIAAGYRSFGFFGPHHFFHTRDDTPETTEPAFLEPIARGLVNVLETLERGG